MEKLKNFPFHDAFSWPWRHPGGDQRPRIPIARSLGAGSTSAQVLRRRLRFPLPISSVPWNGIAGFSEIGKGGKFKLVQGMSSRA